ncbi:MAG: phosphoesterase [Acidobacteria bacterium]|nr:MAG: phosphoesterase [Acidobacteriota bacterium]
MTKKLYLEDPYVTSFEAEILETRDLPEGIALVFDATYFYPESGGQPYDLGTIDGIEVTKVLESEDDTILHFVEKRPEGLQVRCEIDTARRHDHMQQHSGQHVLSAAFVREAGAETTSFHLGAKVSTIDLDKSSLSNNQVDAVERAVSDVVARAVPIKSRFVESVEAKTLELRKTPPKQDSLRIVEVEGFDRQACCGTHPRSSAEIGPVVIRGLEKLKGGTRVEFLCGERALRDYRMTVRRIRSLASVLSSSEAALVETAQKLQDERKSMGKELTRLRSEALASSAEAWMHDADAIGDVHVLAREITGVGPAELRAIAMELAAQPGRVLLLGAIDDGRAHLVFARSIDVDAPMGELLRGSVGRVGGRGGGSPQVSQGGGPDTQRLREALEDARSTLAKRLAR